jgi:PIN domain nuclease of toxin-antitoxin system
MTTYVLDSSAVLRYIDDEAGADRVEEILSNCAGWRCNACLSAIQWGEVFGRLRHRLGANHESEALDSFPSELKIVAADEERAVRAAALKVDRKIAYADAFALDLAMSSADHILVTADFGFIPAQDLARIEFLPQK